MNRILPDLQAIYKDDPMLDGFRDHIGFRWQQYQSCKKAIAEVEGSVAKFAQVRRKQGLMPARTGQCATPRVRLRSILVCARLPYSGAVAGAILTWVVPCTGVQALWHQPLWRGYHLPRMGASRTSRMADRRLQRLARHRAAARRVRSMVSHPSRQRRRVGSHPAQEPRQSAPAARRRRHHRPGACLDPVCGHARGPGRHL